MYNIVLLKYIILIIQSNQMYSTNHYIQTSYYSVLSVESGVQGTVLGQLLFLPYKNDLPESVSSKIKLFADDKKLYRNTKEK